MNIFITGNFTLDFLADALAELRPEDAIGWGGFELFRQELLAPPTELRTAQAVVLALDWRAICPALYTFSLTDDPVRVAAEFRQACVELKSLVAAFRSRSTAHMLLLTPLTENYSPFGFIDRALPCSLTRLFAKCQSIVDEVLLADGAVHAVDMDRLVSAIGGRNAFDHRLDALARSPFSTRCYESIAAWISAILQQLAQAPLKCVVLDCDNTLWGGIVGEDGLAGIRLDDQGVGRCYRRFQTDLARLNKQGVLLALCSKNNERDVWEVFDKHQGMVLTRSMISAHQIHWNSKADSLLQIAKDLNIDPSALLFVDDNPAERAQVAALAPQVCILELPADPAVYSTALRACGRLMPVQLTGEDAAKSAFYSADQHRQEDSSKTADLSSFLRDSRIEARIATVAADKLARVAQLFGKTNQFNLTTTRHSQQQLELYASQGENRLWCVSLKDRYGDYGIIGAALTLANSIDSFLISCRAFGRQVEVALLAAILADLARRGYPQAIGLFRPTPKNMMTREFYPEHGFARLSETDAERRFTIALHGSLLKSPDWIALLEE